MSWLVLSRGPAPSRLREERFQGAGISFNGGDGGWEDSLPDFPTPAPQFPVPLTVPLPLHTQK